MNIEITTAIAILGCLLAVLAFIDNRRKAAVLEGRQQERLAQMKSDLDHLHEKIRALESGSGAQAQDIREIKNDIKWIREMIEKIEARLPK